MVNLAEGNIMMDSNKYLTNLDFIRTRVNKKSIASISLEQMQNLLQTIKEYREYSDPDSPNWIDYINIFFHIMGFETVLINSRVGYLREINNDNSARVVIGVSLPAETIDQVTPWLSWPFLLSTISIKYQSQFGVLTNGQEIRLYDFKQDYFESNYFSANIDSIVTDSREDSLLTLFSIFSFLKVENNYTSGSENPSMAGRYSVIENTGNIPSQPDSHHRRKSPSSKSDTEQLPPSLIRVTQVCKRIIIHGDDFDKACEVIANKNSITVQTVRQDCTARIHIKSDRFGELIQDKDRLVKRLNLCYPKCEEEIGELLKFV
jgi:hypothetical protein